MASIHVVIPCYNVEKYLKTAVNSILNQPFKKINIVLVDDGSPGTTPALCDELAETSSRIYVIHKENGGLCSARNAGIQYALDYLVDSPCDYIGFLDGDDAWIPNVLNNDIEDVLNTGRYGVIGYSGVYSNATMDHFSAMIALDDYPEMKGTEAMWIAQRVHCASKLYSVKLIDQFHLRFLENQLYTEDKIFVFQACFLAEKVRLVGKALHIYRSNEAGIMSSLLQMDAKSHYLPIIDGWLRSDEYLNRLKEMTGRTCRSGSVLAALYLVEMIADYIQQGGRLCDMKQSVELHKAYQGVVQANPKDYSKRDYRFISNYLHHSSRFQAKYRMLGIAKKITLLALKLKFVRYLRERRKYAYTELP